MLGSQELHLKDRSGYRRHASTRATTQQRQLNSVNCGNLGALGEMPNEQEMAGPCMRVKHMRKP